MHMYKKQTTYLMILFLIPLLIALGVIPFRDRSYMVISIFIAILSFVPIFFTFERGKTNTRKMVMLAVMIAMSVVGRFIFAALPGFKPVTAIVVITAMFFGAEAGFLVGALSALLSNFYFGQGPWTPFQMFSWGMIGFIAGLPYISEQLKSRRLLLILYGIFAGIVFSLLMDIWTVMALDGTFHFSRYVATVALSLPFMAVYAVSNVIFLLLTIKPIGEKLERIRVKYGM